MTDTATNFDAIADYVNSDDEEEASPFMPEPQTTSFETPIYKEWFRSKTAAGFIAITPWFDGKDGKAVGKVVVEIGTVKSDNTIGSATKCYVEAIDLAVYLRAVVNGSGEKIYKARQGVYSPESFVTFGGSAGSDPTARVFKIEWWGSNKEKAGDPSGFVWKCGHFAGKVQNSGAIMPDYTKPKSGDMIRRSRLEMHTISYKLDLALASWAARNPEWHDH